ncbi:MAG: alpha-ketoacid dehydrogenase subunit beta [Nitrospinae bacterium]|nr:alpha-ketoacid dehydrogenase subunit beta [Nitrospinota bacterium]
MAEKTFAEALREAIKEEFLRDENVVLFGEDVGIHGGAFGVTRGLWDEFGGKQLFDTPLSEVAIAGTAVGAAMTGLRPIAEMMYLDFITIAMDQVVNQAAKIRYMFGGKAKLPLVIRTPCGGGRGNAAQHSQSLEAWFVHVPGLKVVMPSTPYDAKGLLKTAIRDDNPVIFIEHKLLYGTIRQDIPSEEYLIPFGKGDIKREGKDVTLVATSLMVHKALKAADELLKHGINVEIIDPRTLFPLDKDIIINSVKKTGRLVVVHEAPVRAGIGAEIVAMVTGEAFEYLDSPPRRVGGLHCPIPYELELEKEVIPDEEDIINAVKSL